MSGFKKYGDERSASQPVAETRPEDNDPQTYESAVQPQTEERSEEADDAS